MLEGLDQRRHRDLAYERQKTMLEDAKLESQRTRERESRIPEVTKGITDILEDKETDPFQKEELLSRYALRYPRMASKGVTGVLFTAANAAVSAQGRGIAYRQGKEDRKLAELKTWATRGMPDAVAFIAGDDGEITSDENRNIALAGLVKQFGESKAKAVSDKADHKSAVIRAEKEITEGYKFLEGLRFEEPDDALMSSILNNGAAPVEQEDKLTKDSRESLITRMSKITKQSREKLRKYSDADLLDTAALYLRNQQETLQHATGSTPRPTSKAYKGFGQ